MKIKKIFMKEKTISFCGVLLMIGITQCLNAFIVVNNLPIKNDFKFQAQITFNCPVSADGIAKSTFFADSVSVVVPLCFQKANISKLIGPVWSGSSLSNPARTDMTVTAQAHPGIAHIKAEDYPSIGEDDSVVYEIVEGDNFELIFRRTSNKPPANVPKMSWMPCNSPYVSSDNNETCFLCPANTYRKKDSLSIKCEPCRAGTISNSGSSFASQCKVAPVVTPAAVAPAVVTPVIAAAPIEPIAPISAQGTPLSDAYNAFKYGKIQTTKSGVAMLDDVISQAQSFITGDGICLKIDSKDDCIAQAQNIINVSCDLELK